MSNEHIPTKKADEHVTHSRSDSDATTLAANYSPKEYDDEANFAWEDKPSSLQYEMEELLESGGSSPVLKQETDSDAEDLEDPISEGARDTTWQAELKTMLRTAPPLVATFLLQYSLTMTSIFSVGRLGKTALAASTLASTTANITGFAIYSGLCTGLDTLAAQAYGSGNLPLVGLQMQRMVLFLMLVTIPMACIWFNAGAILSAIVPDAEVAALAGQYLSILVLGAPGYAIFESGKRFLQAQGIFVASTACLCFTAPLNILLHYLFIFRFDLGFLGAPAAVVIANWTLPAGLLVYVLVLDRSALRCWGGLSKAAFTGWRPMISLSVPGVVNVLAEWSAFELMTLSSSWLSTSHLAAQAVVLSLISAAFSIPFAVSISMSTRVANLVGAGRPSAVRVACKVSLACGVLFAAADALVLLLGREKLPRLMTGEADVVALAVGVMPVVAFLHILDSASANSGGLLRGLGMQHISGYSTLIGFYVIGLPISFMAAFWWKWGLLGLWSGLGIGLATATGIQAWYIFHADLMEAVKAAKKRNMVSDL